MKHLVIVRGGGELASGTIHALYRAGFRVLVLEQKEPSATRRRVAFSEAMYRGEAKVERIVCHKAKNLIEAKDRLKKGELVMLEDPEARCVKELKPQVLVDAIIETTGVGGCDSFPYNQRHDQGYGRTYHCFRTWLLCRTGCGCGSGNHARP